MDSIHSAFGLKIRSNICIPGLARLEDSGSAPDLRMYLGVPPYSGSRVSPGEEELTYESVCRDNSGNPLLRIWSSHEGLRLHLAYNDGTEFWLDRKGRAAWAVWPKKLSLEEAASYLLGPVLGLLLRLRGMTCLHASAVTMEDRCVVFAGPEGAGKSTTAAAFAREGYAVLSDDIVALEERDGAFQVIPAYPHLCLWPDSVKMLYGSPDALPRFVPDWDKRCLALDGREARFEGRPLPLGAIYVLGERRPEQAPCVQKIGARDALLSLVAETYANTILDRELRAAEFVLLGRLVGAVPIRRIYPHQDAARLKELCSFVRDDFASLHFPVRPSPENRN